MRKPYKKKDEVRVIHELLILLRKKYVYYCRKDVVKGVQIFSICETVALLVYDNNINSEEEIILFKYLIDNRPLGSSNTGYWWVLNNTKSRKDWLNSRIKIEQKKYRYNNK